MALLALHGMKTSAEISTRDGAEAGRHHLYAVQRLLDRCAIAPVQQEVRFWKEMECVRVCVCACVGRHLIVAILCCVGWLKITAFPTDIACRLRSREQEMSNFMFWSEDLDRELKCAVRSSRVSESCIKVHLAV